MHGQASSDSETSTGEQGSELQDDQARNGISLGVQVWNPDQLESMIQSDAITQFTNNIINVPREISADVMTGEENAVQRGDWQEPVTGDGQTNLPRSNFAELDQWSANPQANMGHNWQGSSGNALQWNSHGNDGEELNNIPHQQIWPDEGSRATLGSLSGGRLSPLRTRRGTPRRRISRFHPPDDDNVYSMELRELLSR